MLLRDLASCPAIACPPTTTRTGVARTMSDADIGFVVVVDAANKPLGVVTDRDIVVRAVATAREDATAADVMTRHAVCVPGTATITYAARAMANRQCRRLVVTGDDGTLIGVLSIDDLLAVAGDELREIAYAVRGSRRTRVGLP
jgi:CBS domain-containing protein